MNSGEVIAATMLTTVLAGELVHLSTPPHHGVTMDQQHAPAPPLHLHGEQSASDVTVSLTGLQMTASAGVVRAVQAP